MKNITRNLLNDLKQVTEQLTKEEYTQELDYLSGATFGKHVRHILDFYMCLIRSQRSESVNYDERNRDLDIENSVQEASKLIEAICAEIDGMDLEQNVPLIQTFGDETFKMQSTILRELSYNLEHSIHHMAMLKIALRQSFTHVKYDNTFGIAFSTVAHNCNKTH